MNKVLAAGAAVVAVIAVGVAVVAAQPGTLHIERSLAIAATPATVFPYANDFTKWSEWSPWLAMDPDQKIEISPTSSGVGAWTTWEGDDNVGKGKMTITESTPHILVKQQIDFVEPWASTAIATIAIEPIAEGSTVTWAFDSPQDFTGKAMGLFMDMDSMIGADFERGLARLKTAAETKAAEEAKARAEEEAQRAAIEDEATKALEAAFREALKGEDGALEIKTLDW